MKNYDITRRAFLCNHCSKLVLQTYRNPRLYLLLNLVGFAFINHPFILIVWLLAVMVSFAFIMMRSNKNVRLARCDEKGIPLHIPGDVFEMSYDSQVVVNKPDILVTECDFDKISFELPPSPLTVVKRGVFSGNLFLKFLYEHPKNAELAESESFVVYKDGEAVTLTKIKQE